MQKSSALGFLAILGLLAAAPVAFAFPINPSLTWSVQFVPLGLSTTATANVAIDVDCPSGQTYQGTITVVQPDGVSTGTVTVGPTPCGTPVTAVYPTGFAGSAATTQAGTYTATWAGTTSATVGGFHPTFSLQDNFFAGAFRPVPEFPVLAMLPIAIALAALMLVRRVVVVR